MKLDPLTRRAAGHLLAVVTLNIATVETIHTSTHCVLLGCTGFFYLLVAI